MRDKGHVMSHVMRDNGHVVRDKGHMMSHVMRDDSYVMSSIKSIVLKYYMPVGQLTPLKGGGRSLIEC